MSQGFNTLLTTNVIKEDVARHNENYETLRSRFSGTSFPAGATAGQPCFRTDRGEDNGLGGVLGKSYTFSGNTSLGENGWLTEEEMNIYSSEIVNARGSKLTLDQRLDISINEDGTLKAGVTGYQSEWVLPALTFTYLSTTTFKTNGNTTDIYLATRRLKTNLSTSVLFTEVVSSIYDSGQDETTITISDASLDNTLVSVEHGIISPLSNNGSLSYYTQTYIDASLALKTDVSTINTNARLWDSQTTTHNFTTDADYTLTTTQNEYGRIIITDTGTVLTAPRNVIVDNKEKAFIAVNETSHDITFKTSLGAGVILKTNASINLYNNGTDIIYIGNEIGVNQSWQDVSGSRSLETPNLNDTGRTIKASVILSIIGGTGSGDIGSAQLLLSSAGVANPVAQMISREDLSESHTLYLDIPNGETYTISDTSVGAGSVTISRWHELR